MTFYCMHDAPSGVQNKTTFINKSGRKIEKGEIHSVQCPWTFLNPVLEDKLLEEFVDEEGYIENPDYDKLTKIIKDNIAELKLNPELLHLLHSNNEEYIIKSINKLRQSYKFIAMKKGDYLIIRGKKGHLDEAYLFEIIDQTNIFYTNVNNSNTNIKVICKIPDRMYQKIYAKRASFWEIKNEEDIEEFRTLID